MIKLVEVVCVPLKDEFEIIDGINIGEKFSSSGLVKSYDWVDLLFPTSRCVAPNSTCFSQKEKINLNPDYSSDKVKEYYISYIKDYQIELLPDGFAKITMDCDCTSYDEVKIKKGIADKMLIFINHCFYYSKAKRVVGRYFDKALLEVSEGDAFLLKRDPYKDEVTPFIVLRKDNKLYIEQVIQSKKFFYS